jgi:hypothetical protein
VRVYPRASDARHLLGLVRAGRDRVATRRGRGLVACVLGGALLGALTAGVLATAFDLLGGLELALPFGLFVGAFLGAFTGAMTGTEVARDEVRALARMLKPGDVLVSIAGALAAIAGRCDADRYACRGRE